MSLAELVVVSVEVEGRSKSEVARDYKVSRYWVQQLVKRYEREGEAAFTPRSRRPHSNPRAIGLELEDRIVRLRKDLAKRGLDAGAETIRVHLQRDLQRDPALGRVPSTSTIWRILTRRGFVTPQPKKRPKGAGTRFCAEMPNERWQADITHWRLADGTDVEILNIEDDHSRLDLLSKARPTPPAPRPPRPHRSSTCTTESDATASTPAESSPSATTANCAISASAANTTANASSPSSPTATSASSTTTPANSCANSPSTPTRTTNPSADHPAPAAASQPRRPQPGSRLAAGHPKGNGLDADEDDVTLPNGGGRNATMSRDTRQRCLGTSDRRARRDSNPQPSDP